MAAAMMSAFAFQASAQVVSTQPNAQLNAVSNVVTENTQPQQTTTLTNAQLSTQCKLQMDVVNNEIKTLKSQQKLYKGDPAKTAEVASFLASKKSELAELKAKKSIADKAIKAEKASKKAAEKAEKARKKAEAASQKAAQLQK